MESHKSHVPNKPTRLSPLNPLKSHQITMNSPLNPNEVATKFYLNPIQWMFPFCHGGTPSSHEISNRIFHELNQPAFSGGTPMET